MGYKKRKGGVGAQLHLFLNSTKMKWMVFRYRQLCLRSKNTH